MMGTKRLICELSPVDRYHKDHDHSPVEAVVFENSIDCLIYGYGLSFVNGMSLPKEKVKELYFQARDFLGGE